jgi:hypothetical protein
MPTMTRADHACEQPQWSTAYLLRSLLGIDHGHCSALGFYLSIKQSHRNAPRGCVEHAACVSGHNGTHLGLGSNPLLRLGFSVSFGLGFSSAFIINSFQKFDGT